MLLLGTVAAAPPPPRVGTNPLRARRAWELGHRVPAPNPDAGPDAGSGEGNPDGGDVVDGQEFWWIGATSPSTSFPNTGAQAVMQEVDTYPPKGFGCFDCWTSETLDNGLWGQVGFAACNFASGSFVSTFYQIWNTNPPAETLLVDGRTIQSSPGIHTYAMTLLSGTTWDYSVDGAVFGEFDMGSALSSGPSAIATLCEEGDGVSDPFVPQAVSVPVAMSLLGADAGIWAGAPTADVYNTADLSGAAGNLQDSSLPDDAIGIGGTIPFTTAGTKLWKGTAAGFAPDAGPAGSSVLAPPLVRLTAPRPTATLSGTVTLTGTVTVAAAGSAIMGVSFYVEDANGIVQQSAAQGPPYSAAWDTTGVANGDYFIFLQAVDAEETQTYVDISVTVDNGRGTTSGTSGGRGTGTSGASSSTGTASSTGTSSGGSSTGSSSGSTSGGATAGSSVGTTGGSSTGERQPSGPAETLYRGTGCGTGGGGLAAVPLLLWILAWRGSRRSRSAGATQAG